MEENNISRRKMLRNISYAAVGTAIYPTAWVQNSSFLEDPKTVFIPPGGGIKGKISRTDITFKLDKIQTSGHLGSSELVIPPGQLGAPPHLHKTFDEICIVLEGAVHIMVEDEVIEVKKGGWHLRPRNKVHTFWNSGIEDAKVIELCTPGGHEVYMMELANLFNNGAKPDPNDLGKLAQKHDIVFRFDKLEEIMKRYNVSL